jgi:hypothetical protein
MRASELRTILELHDDDAEVVIELPGTERGVQAASWAFTPDGTKVLILADL